jgi:hypothetical protein
MTDDDREAEINEEMVLSWLANHGAALDPNGNAIHRQLCRLVEKHGRPAVLAAFEEMAGEATEARQYVFGADNRLNAVPKPPRAARPVDPEAAEIEARSRRERTVLEREKQRRAGLVGVT